jgi:truncated hemoglobin YjbI
MLRARKEKHLCRQGLEMQISNHSPLPSPHKAGPILPRANAPEIAFAGFVFTAGDPPALPGIFVLTRRIGDFVYPVLMGEAEDMAAALEKLHLDDPVLAAGLADGACWMARAPERMRVHVLRELVGKYDPPLNVEHRKGRAAPEIAALASDRGKDLPAGEAEHGAARIEASEDEIRALVQGFYETALVDPLIGAVFKRNIADWEHHFKVAADFWSRSLLGTTRYNGSPFTPHLSLNLKPEFFERWIALFKAAATNHLQPAAASMAIAKVEHMSVCFQAGLFPARIAAAENPTETVP